MGKFGNRALPKFMKSEEVEENIEPTGRIQELQEGHNAPEIISVGEVSGEGVLITIKTVEGEEVELLFMLDADMEEIEDGSFKGSISAEHNDVDYSIDVELTEAGDGDFDIKITDDSVNADENEPVEDEEAEESEDEEVYESKVLRFDQFTK